MPDSSIEKVEAKVEKAAHDIASGKAPESTESNLRYAAYANRLRIDLVRIDVKFEISISYSRCSCKNYNYISTMLSSKCSVTHIDIISGSSMISTSTTHDWKRCDPFMLAGRYPRPEQA
ncbi:hypothetical protein V1527DRAFT_512849 [Lipomyces starkeyi]